MEDKQRAYGMFTVKAMDDGRRTFKGWATTPATDRMGDIVNPMGVKFTNPVALLHQHRHDSPVGLARFQKPTVKGIEFDAEMPDIPEEGSLKDRIDTAWGEVKHGLVRAVSIGFRPIKYAFMDDGGIDWQEIEVYELSVVTVPALPQAVITAVKSMTGAPIARELIHAIKEHDYARRKSGPVQLISRAAVTPRDPRAGIPLVQPSDAVRL